MARITLPPDNAGEAAREALRRACDALGRAEAGGCAALIAQALRGVAQAYGALRAWSTAEAYLEMALRWAAAMQATDAEVEVLCDLCDTGVQLAEQQDAAAPGSGSAARERVRDHAFSASARAGRVSDADWEVKVLLRVSDALNRLGDHDEAAALQSRALERMSGSPRTDVALLPSLGRLADA
jgi:tetratricopeptide (TPR) repeat protein